MVAKAGTGSSAGNYDTLQFRLVQGLLVTIGALVCAIAWMFWTQLDSYEKSAVERDRVAVKTASDNAKTAAAASADLAQKLGVLTSQVENVEKSVDNRLTPLVTKLQEETNSITVSAEKLDVQVENLTKQVERLEINSPNWNDKIVEAVATATSGLEDDSKKLSSVEATLTGVQTTLDGVLKSTSEQAAQLITLSGKVEKSAGDRSDNYCVDAAKTNKLSIASVTFIDFPVITDAVSALRSAGHDKFVYVSSACDTEYVVIRNPRTLSDRSKALAKTIADAMNTEVLEERTPKYWGVRE